MSINRIKNHGKKQTARGRPNSPSPKGGAEQNGHAPIYNPWDWEYQARKALNDPSALARVVLHFYRNRDGCRLRYWHDQWYEWKHGRYQELSKGELRGRATQRVQRYLEQQNVSELRMAEEGKKLPEAKQVTAHLMNNVLMHLESECLVPNSASQPDWIDRDAAWSEEDKEYLEKKEDEDQRLVKLNPHDFLNCNGKLVHLPSFVNSWDNYVSPSSPAFFTTTMLDYNFNPQAPEPTEWLRFLEQVFDGDKDSIDLLQEWFGYCLLPDNSQHKILMLVGPKRSGKGTIAKVLSALVGKENVTSPSLSGLGGPFGLWPLVGKSVAIISDARLSGRSDIAQVVENLLRVSGDDEVDVHRKCLPRITVNIKARFLIMTNELPRLLDASGAMASRFLLLRMRNSYYGKEDIELASRLLGELSGILLWAIKGWDRLQMRGRFIEPADSEEMAEELEDLSSPIKAFVKDECVVKPHATVTVSELFRVWQVWCNQTGREHPSDIQRFSANLRAAFPQLNKPRQIRQCGARIRVFDGIRLKGEDE